MNSTFTRSETNTYTEARAIYVMGKVHDDLIGLTSRKIITPERASKIKSDVLYLLNKQVIKYFQLQFREKNGTEIGGLHYALMTNGAIISDENSGNIDYWTLSTDISVTLLVDLDNEASNYSTVSRELSELGWGTGKALTGTHDYLKSYSKDGYGLNQSKIGTW